MNIRWLLFSFNGRIGRLAFFAVASGVALTGVAVVGASLRLAGAAFPETPADFQALAATQSEFRGPILIWQILAGWIQLAAGAKRLHDIGRSGWLNLWLALATIAATGVAVAGYAAHSSLVWLAGYLLLLIVLIYGLWVGLLQLFRRGDEDANDFGEPSGQSGTPPRERVLRVFEAGPAIARPAEVAGGFGKRH